MFHAKGAKKAKRAKGNDSSSLRALLSLLALRETDNSLQKDFPYILTTNHKWNFRTHKTTCFHNGIQYPNYIYLYFGSYSWQLKVLLK